MDSRNGIVQERCQYVGPLTQILWRYHVEMTGMARQMKNCRWRQIAQICRDVVIIVMNIRGYVGTPEFVRFSPFFITAAVLCPANGQVEAIIHAWSEVTWSLFCKRHIYNNKRPKSI